MLIIESMTSNLLIFIDIIDPFVFAMIIALNILGYISVNSLNDISYDGYLLFLQNLVKTRIIFVDIGFTANI